jgi:hypothetical protein
MMSEKQRGKEFRAVQRRILSIEEEVEERGRGDIERGERAFFEETYVSGDRKLIALGTRHTGSPKELESIVERYRAHNPDILLYEGRPIREIFPGLSDDEIRGLRPEDVAKRQEQAFLAWTAFCEGKEARAWDPSMVEQLQEANKKHSIKAIEGCLTAVALQKIYESNIPPTPEAFEALLGVLLLRSDREPLQKAGFDFSYEGLNAVCQKYVGRSVEELHERWGDEQKRREDLSRFRGLSDPAYRGETNDVLRDANVLRDRHAVEMIEELKNKYGSIFVMGGGTHIRTWRPALKEIYA